MVGTVTRADLALVVSGGINRRTGRRIRPAQQRHTALVGIDPKRVELAPLRDRFIHLVVGNEAEPTIALLRALVGEL